MPRIIPEQQLLLNLLRGQSNPGLEGMNMDILFDLFLRHRLLPLAVPLLPLLGNDEKKKWKEAIQYRSLRSVHLSSVLSDIIRELADAEIRAIPLKGPVLAYGLYSDPGQRHFTDLDILIRRSDLEKTIEIAKNLGFTVNYPKPDLSPRKWEYYFRYKRDVGLANPGQKAYIELHTSIYAYELLLAPEEEHLFDNLCEQVINDTPLQCMNQNHTFLYLAYHGGHHRYMRLFWLRDVSVALERWNLDHLYILELAKSLGIDRLLGMSLLLAEDLCRSRIPSEYSQYLRQYDRELQKLKRFSLERILGPENETPLSKLRLYRFLLNLRPGFNYKWSVVESIFHRWYIRKFLEGIGNQ